MCEPSKNSKTVTHIDFIGPVFTTAVQAQKQKKRKLSRGPKTPVRGVRFIFRLNMYLFLVQCEQVNLFLALAIQVHIYGRDGGDRTRHLTAHSS